MSVQVTISSVKPINGSNLSSVVELSNFNFNSIKSAITEYLTTVNYNQGTSGVSVDISGISADTLLIRQGLTIYNTNTSSPAITLLPSGSILTKNLSANGVVEALSFRIMVYGQIPTSGYPGEIIYVTSQVGKIEGFYGYLLSTGWTLLSGGSSGCKMPIIRTVTPNTITGDNCIISPGLVTLPSPIINSEYLLFINGLQIQIGDGTSNAPVYFSKDGSTPSIYKSIDSTDNLYWNSSIAGYGLDSNDTVTLIYSTIDPYCSASGIVCETNLISKFENSGSIPQVGISIYLDSTAANSAAITSCSFPTPSVSPINSVMPSGYYVTNSVGSYEISSSIDLGSMTVTFTVPNTISETDFNTLKVFQLINGVWVDCTILTGPYAPNFSTFNISCHINQLGQFYIVPYSSITPSTTTTTSPTLSTTTTTVAPTTTCPPGSISFSILGGGNQVAFIGTPTGPYSVRFTDISSNVYNLTSMHGNQISLSWIFDITDPEYAGISTVHGTYLFLNNSGCSYSVTV